MTRLRSHIATGLGLDTLVGRISSTFFVLAILLAALQYLLISRLWNLAEQEVRQKLEWHLADELSIKLQAIINQNPEGLSEKIKYRLQEFETINPRILLSIVDAHGKQVLEFYRPASHPVKTQNRVPEEILAQASSTDLGREFPMYGPTAYRSDDKVSTIFSIGKLYLRGEQLYLYAELDNPQYRSVIRGLEVTYLFVGGGLTSIGLVLGLSALGFFSISGISKRFRAFTDGVNKIASGYYSARVPISGNDEVSTLGKQINHMAERIETSIYHLKENDRWRKEMTASLSHDLNTPLSAMLAHNEQLIRNLDHEKDRELLKRLSVFERNLHTMHKYIDGVLELSKLESRQLSIDIGPFHILEVVEDEILPRLKPLADEHGMSLTSTVPEDAKLVYFDSILFQRVLENLIGNALKYSQGNRVTVDLEVDGEFGWVGVTDDGCGIAKESIAEILKPFTRGDSARSSSNPGSGLGLAIVSLILKAHGSELEIVSSPGRGTRMRFRVGRTESAAARMRESAQAATNFFALN